MRWRWTIVNFTVCQNTISSSCYDYITHDNPNCLCTSTKEFSYKFFTSPFIAWMLESTEGVAASDIDKSLTVLRKSISQGANRKMPWPFMPFRPVLPSLYIQHAGQPTTSDKFSMNTHILFYNRINHRSHVYWLYNKGNMRIIYATGRYTSTD